MSFKLINRNCYIHHHKHFAQHALRATSLLARSSYRLPSALLQRLTQALKSATIWRTVSFQQLLDMFNHTLTCRCYLFAPPPQMLRASGQRSISQLGNALNFFLLLLPYCLSLRYKAAAYRISRLMNTQSGTTCAIRTSRLIYYDRVAIIAVVLAMFASFRRLLSTSSCRRFILLALRASLWSSQRSPDLSVLACIHTFVYIGG